MGVSRRFLNLIVAGRTPGVKSLRRIDLMRQQLFYPDTPAPPSPEGDDGSGSAAGEQGAASRPPVSKMELPRRAFTFRASAPALNGEERKIQCLPLADCKVLCADESGRGFLLDANARKVSTMPPLHKPMAMPVSVFVPKPDFDDAVSVYVPKPDVDDDICHNGYGSCIFLMERALRPEPLATASRGALGSEQFVGVINRNPDEVWGGKSWHRHLLPPPPFVREPRNWDSNRPQITTYSVVGGDSHVCISVEGVGTYCLDTVSHAWSEVGEWTLPFHGKVEYVPELKLWFGLSAERRHLAAADLSDMDSEPQLVSAWKEELDPPEEWKECEDSQFVSLGSGRFCIARFFQTTPMMDGNGDGSVDFTVFTGVEVVNRNRNGDGKVELRMVPHKSRRVNKADIEALF